MDAVKSPKTAPNSPKKDQLNPQKNVIIYYNFWSNFSKIDIISDMEFDCIDRNQTSFEFYKQKFEEAGYELPEIVFWNVEARDTHLPVTMNEKGVKLISGASANIFASVVSGDLKVVTPYEFMLQMLEPYAEFDKLVA